MTRNDTENLKPGDEFKLISLQGYDQHKSTIYYEDIINKKFIITYVGRDIIDCDLLEKVKPFSKGKDFVFRKGEDFVFRQGFEFELVE